MKRLAILAVLAAVGCGGSSGPDAFCSVFAAQTCIYTGQTCTGHEASCVECHAPGAVGGNPHPVGWAGTAAQATSDPVCLRCHG